MKKMTDEDKDFLYIDLCARLPYYGLMVRWGDDDFNIIGAGFGRITLLKPFMSSISGSPLVEEVRPYLRPMSSMTESEAKDMYKTLPFADAGIISVEIEADRVRYYVKGLGHVVVFFNRIFTMRQVDWLNKNHFDYRIVPSTGKNMIESGLAIEAKEGMYKTE